MDDNHYVKLPCIPYITVSPSILVDSHPAAFYLTDLNILEDQNFILGLVD